MERTIDSLRRFNIPDTQIFNTLLAEEMRESGKKIKEVLAKSKKEFWAERIIERKNPCETIVTDKFEINGTTMTMKYTLN